MKPVLSRGSLSIRLALFTLLNLLWSAYNSTVVLAPYWSLLSLASEMQSPAAVAKKESSVPTFLAEPYCQLGYQVSTSNSGALLYQPSKVEEYVFKNAQRLGYNKTDPPASTCSLWKDSKTASEIHSPLLQYERELRDYAKRLENFPGTVKDLREHLTEDNHTICDSLELHKDGLAGIFKSGVLSQTTSGLVEPLLPPLRHPGICWNKTLLLSMDYLVHDFASMCRQLKPTSRTVLVDMGASLDFHHGETSPAVYLTKLFQRFGFRFDHVYAFEIKQKKPQKVFQAVPDDLRAAYHWINVGVETDPMSGNNPLKLLKDNFREDDFVIVKLDIDTPFVELPLAQQLLQDDSLNRLVDSFYFEQHVHLGELRSSWGKGNGMACSVQDSLELFAALRKRGIPAHSWV
jgi:hypothetical protein